MGRGALDIDAVIDLLSAERRRVALRVLSDRETSLTLADLADEVAVRERQASIDEISAEDTKRTYLDLYHTHVPKLAEREAIDYHQERDMVTPTENIGRVTGNLDILHRANTIADEDPCAE